MDNVFDQFDESGPQVEDNPFDSVDSGSPYAPHANNDAGYKARLAMLNMRAKQDELANPQPNAFVQTGDEIARAALQIAPPAVVGAVTAPFGPEAQVPMTAAAAALGNRAAHVYGQARGMEKPSGNPFDNLLEDTAVAGTTGLGMALPAGPIADAIIPKALPPIINPVAREAVRGAARIGVGAATNAGLDIMMQQANGPSDIDWRRAGAMGVIGGLTHAPSEIPATLGAMTEASPNTPFVEAASQFGFNGSRADLAEAGQVLQQARNEGFTGQNIYSLQQWLKNRNAPGAAPTEPTSKTAKEVAGRMALVDSPEQKLAVLNQETKLRGDTLSEGDQRTALDAKLQLEEQVDAQKTVDEQQKKLVDIQDSQQEAADRQQAEIDKQQKLQEQLQAEQIRQAKEKDSAIAEQQKALEEPPPFEQKQPNLANSSAQAASNMEAQPGTMQSQLNAMTQAAPQAPAALSEPISNPAALPEPVSAPAAFPEPMPITKDAVIKQAIATPGVDWQYTVQKPLVPGGKGFVQIDAIANGQNLTSSNLADLNAAGANLPEVPDWIPQGQYTKGELENMIAKGEPEVKAMSADKDYTKIVHEGLRISDKLESSGYTWTDTGEGFAATLNSPDGFQWRLDKNKKIYEKGPDESLWREANDGDMPSVVSQWFANVRQSNPAYALPKELDVEPAKKPGKLQKSANVGRIVKMMGDKLYSADVSKTTGKELFQNTADAVMRNPEGSPRDIYYGYVRKGDASQFHIADNGPGMSPELIMEKFLPAGESGKSVGSAGGLGLAKIAILGGNKGWTVNTTTRNPAGGFIHTVLKGSGTGYYDYIDNPPSVELKPGVENEISDGITLKYDYIPENPRTKTGTLVSVDVKDGWNASNFVDSARQYTPDINFHSLDQKEYLKPDMQTPQGKGNLSVAYPYDEKKVPFGLVHTIQTPYGTIDIIAPQDAKLKKSNYHYYDVLNRGILQFTGEVTSRDGLALPKGFAINVKPTVSAEDKLYPFTTNREELISAAKKEVDRYLAESGEREVKKRNDAYASAVENAPKLSDGSGLHFLDAGQVVQPELMHEIANNPIVHVVASEISDIQNSILSILKKRYPNESGFGRAKFRGLLTGSGAYGVHFGKRDAPETGIYHDPFLTWRDAVQDASDFIETNHPGIGDEAKNAMIPKVAYEFWRSKTIGISLHEALHQVINSEGEDLARGLTFKAGDLIDAVPANTSKDIPYQQINDTLNDYYYKLSEQKSPEDAGNLIISQGGYDGYALRDAGPNPQGAGLPPQAGGQAPVDVQENSAAITPAAGHQLTDISGTAGPIPGRSAETNYRASARRQQRGAASTEGLMTGAGSIGGGAYGFLSTTKEKDESEEHFQARRIMRMLGFGLAGGTGARVLAPYLLKSGAQRRAAILKTIQNEAKGVDAPAWWVKLRAQERLGTNPILRNIKPAAIRTTTNNVYARFSDAVAQATLEGHEIPPEANVHAKSITMPTKLAEAMRQQDELDKSLQGHLVDVAKASGMGVDQFIFRFNVWLAARDAPFYNLHLADRHALSGDPGPAPTGMLSDDESFAVLKMANEDGLESAFEKLAEEHKAYMEGTRDILQKGGLITAETRKHWEQLFPYYINRQRIMPDDSLDDAIMSHLGGGPGNSVRSSGVQPITQTGSKLDMQDLWGNARAARQDALSRVFHNDMVKSAAMFIKNQAFNGVEVKGVDYHDYLEPNIGPPKVVPSGIPGNVKLQDFDPTRMVAFMDNGKPKRIVFNDPNLATALSGVSANKLNGVFRAMSSLTRNYSRGATGYSLEFLLRNPFMDRSSAAFKALTQSNPSGAAGMINPVSAIKDAASIAKWITGVKDPDTALVQQGMDDGMMGGGYASASRDRAHRFIETLREAKTNPAVWTIEKVKSVYNFLSEVSEATTRLQAYRNAISLGATGEEAAIQGLNSSINFSMRGNQKLASALYGFYNPAQQGGWNLFKNVIRAPHVTAAMLTSMAGMYHAADAWNSSIDPDWRRRPSIAWASNNGPVLLYGVDPKTNEDLFVTIPVSQELRPLMLGAEMAMDYASGKLNSGDNMADRMSQFAGSVVNAANPVGAGPVGNKGVAGSIISMVSPTVGRPLVDIATNKGYTGAPIIPEHQQIDQHLEEYMKRKESSYQQRSGQWAISISKWLHDNLGYDVSPEHIKYLMASYSLGPGRTITSAINVKPTEGNEFHASDVPIIGTFVRRAARDAADTQTTDLNKANKIATQFHTKDTEIHQAAVAYFDRVFKKHPATQWVQGYQNLNASGHIPADPAFREQLGKVLADKIKGLDNVDEVVKGMGVNNGERASYYAYRQSDFRNKEDYLKYLNDQIGKKLITPAVRAQIESLWSRPDLNLVKNKK